MSNAPRRVGRRGTTVRRLKGPAFTQHIASPATGVDADAGVDGEGPQHLDEDVAELWQLEQRLEWGFLKEVPEPGFPERESSSIEREGG
jgi:hypothetical protein